MDPIRNHYTYPGLLEPFRYVTTAPGKGVRVQLMECLLQWYPISDKHILKELQNIVQDLHHASLLVDDIEDNSVLRRGLPVAHSIYGVPAVLNCAYYVIFLALERCNTLQNQKATTCMIQHLPTLHVGQGHDILWRETLHCPTEYEYLQMIRDKTGGLFRLASGLMKAFSIPTTENQNENEIDLDTLMDRLAEYFQIRDDLLNLVDSDMHHAKTYCEDLTEGKFSLPVIHCLNSTASTSTKEKTQTGDA